MTLYLLFIFQLVFSYLTLVLRLGDGNIGQLFYILFLHAGLRLRLLQLVLQMGQHFRSRLQFSLLLPVHFVYLPLDTLDAFLQLFFASYALLDNRVSIQTLNIIETNINEYNSGYKANLELRHSFIFSFDDTDQRQERRLTFQLVGHSRKYFLNKIAVASKLVQIFW